MKTDVFVKVMLVIIAVLLFLNCVKDNGSGGISVPFLEAKAKAAAPAFIQVNKTYKCNVASRTSQNYEIKQIDKENGWIEAKWVIEDSAGYASGVFWFNLSHFQSCSEVKTKSDK